MEVEIKIKELIGFLQEADGEKEVHLDVSAFYPSWEFSIYRTYEMNGKLYIEADRDVNEKCDGD